VSITQDIYVMNIRQAHALSNLPISVCIPTYGREEILLDTISLFLEQRPSAEEILIVDQTLQHDTYTYQRLEQWQEAGDIRWIRLDIPSQPAALNVGLKQAAQPFVLFLDDDIRIAAGFLKAHFEAFDSEDTWAVAGQVLQPEEQELIDYIHHAQTGLLADFDFPFRSSKKCLIQNAMSGNLCVRRERALAIGGFDENFVPPVAYRFDNEFCKRLCHVGGKILFEPKARIYHLRAQRGGTRTNSHHLTSMSPEHGVGDYYFALKCSLGWERFCYMMKRPFREIRTKFHLKHPWWIPVKFVGEIRAMVQAIRLYRQGPKLLPTNHTNGHEFREDLSGTHP